MTINSDVELAGINKLVEEGEITAYHAITFHLFTLPLAEEWLKMSKEILFCEALPSLSHQDLAFAEGKRNMLRVIESMMREIQIKMEKPVCNYRIPSHPMPHESKPNRQR